MNYRPLARRTNFVIQESGDDTLIYDLKSNKAVCLNETAAIIWNLCDGSRSISEIGVEIGKRMKSRVDEDFVWLALDQLNKDGLLIEGFERDDRFAGLTRREVIRKIGIASVIALPIVSSIVAPQASSAQSGGCHTGVCVAQGQPLCPPGCTDPSIPTTAFPAGSGCAGPPLLINLNCPTALPSPFFDISFP